MKKIIHVNQHVIRANGKSGDRNPPLTCKTYKHNTYFHEIEVKGGCKIVYSPDKPLYESRTLTLVFMQVNFFICTSTIGALATWRVVACGSTEVK